ncbi:MAG: hypothetical protein PF505_05220 [Vallitaleaceae bacterium]|jgi:AcrR family transcriptional regulator|nr:hypothetical protein [Vallitaleaceae bacterium]
MARRLIPNLEEKILTEAIHLGSLYGANKISTTELAMNIGIKEPTIYGRYKTKMDLLTSAYYFASTGFEASLRVIDWDNIHELEDFNHVWFTVLDYAINHPSETKYQVSFRKSIDYDTTMQSGYEDYFVMIASKIMSLDSEHKELPYLEYLRLWVYWVDMTLKFSELIITGYLPLNLRTKTLLLQLVFGEHVDMSNTH